MTTHTTPATASAHSEQAAKPTRRASRFDQRGIALQTVIIMVVLLAIAGGVSAVLLTRGSEATSQLEATTDITAGNIFRITNKSLCTGAGGTWSPTGHTVTESPSSPDGKTKFKVDIDDDGDIGNQPANTDKAVAATSRPQCKPAA